MKEMKGFPDFKVQRIFEDIDIVVFNVLISDEKNMKGNDKIV